MLSWESKKAQNSVGMRHGCFRGRHYDLMSNCEEACNYHGFLLGKLGRASFEGGGVTRNSLEALDACGAFNLQDVHQD